MKVPWWESGAVAEVACLSVNAGLVEEGEALARESLAISDGLRDRPGRIFGVGILARVAAERGQRERAGRLWGSIEDEQAGAPLGGWRRHRPTYETRIREITGREFERGRAEGYALTLDDAVSLALATGELEAGGRPPRLARTLPIKSPPMRVRAVAREIRRRVLE